MNISFLYIYYRFKVIVNGIFIIVIVEMNDFEFNIKLVGL